MNWMTRWPGAFPVVFETAEGAALTDVDGNAYVDFCLGDTGAMAGHSPAPTVAAAAAQMERGITTMLPSEDAGPVGDELTRRFGLRHWQFTLTATDANRFAIRLCREITGRPKILVFDHCYHGSVDETFAELDGDGAVVAAARQRRPAGGARRDDARGRSSTTSTALERELGRGRRRLRAGRAGADQRRHRPRRRRASTTALRELTRAAGALLIIDETHTLCCGPGRLHRAPRGSSRTC